MDSKNFNQSKTFCHTVEASLIPQRGFNYHCIIVTLNRTRASSADADGILDLGAVLFIQKSRSLVFTAVLTVSGHLSDRPKPL